MSEKKIDGKEIIDELCTCGHLQSVHNPSQAGLQYGVIVEGHGNCKICRCQQYTWKKFITKK